VGRIRTRPSNEIEGSPWGVNFSSPQAEDWTPVLEKMAAMGVKWARVSVGWGSVETEKGHYDWSKADQVVDFCVENGIEPYANIGRSNEVYFSGEARGTPATRDPGAMEAWKKFLAAAAERYKGRVRYWEMANEPNIRIFWPPEPDAVEYAEFVIEGAKVLKSVDPDCQICAGVTAGIVMDYIREFLAAGTVPYFDVFVYHAYRTVPEGFSSRLTVRAQTDLSQVKLTLDKREIQRLTFLKEFEDLQTLLRRRGFTGPIWQGETGYPSSEDTIHWRGDGPWGEKIQAKFVLRRLMIDWLAGADMSSYFLMLEFSSKINPNLAWGFHPVGKNTKGLLVLEDLSPKPAYYALQRLSSAMAGVARTDQAACLFDDLEVPSGARLNWHLDDVMGWTFAFAGGNKGFAYWVPSGMRELLPPVTATVKIEAAPFEGMDNPVLVDLVEDAVYEVVPDADGDWWVFEDLPLTDYPLILADRADMPLKEIS
jgi:hypothetical protein